MTRAKFWSRGETGEVRCDLCPHACRIREGQTGRCGVRRMDGGELTAAGYGLVSSAAVDPIEKKPLYHFLPGSRIFSIGGWGCNLSCAFCQNWGISQRVEESGARQAPLDVVARTIETGCVGIAYTYNEPLINFEFVEACAHLARARGLVNVLVTNGYVQREPAAVLLPAVDALNIDVKCMQDDFYRKRCGGTLDPVLRFAEQAVGEVCHVEITNLLIPTLNDAPSDMVALADWVAKALGDKTPLHLSAYRPQFKMQIPSTPATTLTKAFRTCRERLPYVYMGNVRTDEGQDTLCPGCGQVLVARSGYATRIEGIAGGACTSCGRDCDMALEATRPPLPPGEGRGT